MSIHAAVQSLTPEAQIFLFRLDASSVGGPVMYFTQAAHAETGVSFGGVYYTPVDVEFSDYELTGQGGLPTPTLRLSNTNEVIQGLVNEFGEDLLGCRVQRVRTFAQFLDGGSQADPGAFYGPDTFEIEQKTAETPVYIEFKLSASIDQEGRMLPGRQILRDTCTWRYRTFRNGVFDYSKVSCPYTGGACFNRLGQPVGDPSQDVCGRRLSDCQARFGEAVPLPFGGFPGVARVRQ